MRVKALLPHLSPPPTSKALVAVQDLPGNLLTAVLVGGRGTGQGGPWSSTIPDITIKIAPSLMSGSGFQSCFGFCYHLDTPHQSACLQFQHWLEDLR